MFVNKRGSQCTCKGKGVGGGEKEKRKGQTGWQRHRTCGFEKRGPPTHIVSERGPVHLQEKGKGKGEGEKNKIKAYHLQCEIVAAGGGRRVGEVASERSGMRMWHFWGSSHARTVSQSLTKLSKSSPLPSSAT